MDKGPWVLFNRQKGELAGVASDDFEHDVTLYVNGDFAGPDQFREYCDWLASRLNFDIERLRKARLVWAMTCRCDCYACEALHAELQVICGDAEAPVVESPAQPGAERG